MDVSSGVFSTVAVGIDVLVSVDLTELTVEGVGECLVSVEPPEDEVIVARFVFVLYRVERIVVSCT